MAQTRLEKKQWNKRKPDDCKRRGSGESSQGGPKQKPDLWVSMGICKFLYP